MLNNPVSGYIKIYMKKKKYMYVYNMHRKILNESV